MPRVKRGTTSLKRRRNILKQTKGYRWGRKSKERAAREALLHAYTHSFHDRRKKKGDFRKLWNIKISAAANERNISYSRLINLLKKTNIRLNRKMLAELAEHHPKAFDAVVKETTKKLSL
ncbi:MAG: 50S ribosomal protein L20 [Candidatus Ryanbacteria bacterium RIFCSPHIGHO2_02_FULL_45_43]|uniref:Large ribosomal subunit protein bL20 n=1 Tax=Candidatus Ryanbacteria bacterium RIFCSPHIGHO2_01_45_13 TaxID=1802112 RepID=A0A1G2FXI3_9BACT|nr:MAG: 50S ribosomal protein L20 [Candidatus Ryanbacteria bacterium RIFCSPHIGHO2_01_FULL_44_130]OGZ42432.1 MAG: 50S ribosomal protein L20 [Candidatus Ryanbacteria bacterium RIFCSPHIGHO2_01_45_13]OGZ48449.1 MAG: 50S ribosomal protein L20 [Candidatus Ryanbacteria bacterium RIFCSPHIGHO2_02_FULL_45_43]OGZ50314.1 MAG: 50S ribosomal protein L20 [Candidatus Ryanbacteria bacterium RIFCSPHIGHO2_12_FULL_44_20]OGZ51653.1 MAG: 50S ribosomal protein L20 [Candidatus Ryanbacteria bacterium RIFCSPLOWO2_01_FUL